MTTTAAAKAPTLTAKQRVSLGSILSAYLQVGLTAFGFTILQKLKSLVLRRRWLNEYELNEGLALVQLYPDRSWWTWLLTWATACAACRAL